MRRFAVLVVFLMTSGLCPAQVSYWFRGWQTKPDARQAQEYFMVPGANVVFTYATNRVIINAAGGGGGTLQLFGDVTSPLTVLPNVTATLKNTGTLGTYVKTTFDAQGRETSGSATLDLATDVTGDLGVTHLAGGVGASGTTFWRGDGTWVDPSSTISVPNVIFNNSGTTNQAGFGAKGASVGGATFENLAVGFGAIAWQTTEVRGTAIGNYAEGWNYGCGVGRSAIAYDEGAAVGYGTAGYTRGVAVGKDSQGNDQGVAVGYGALGFNAGVAIGYQSDAQGGGNIAIGHSAKVDHTCVGVTTEIGGGTATVCGALHYRGNAIVSGAGVLIGSGGIANKGLATFAGSGSVLVSTTAVTATSIIQLTYFSQAPPAFSTVYYGTINPGANFTIYSSNGADTGKVSWSIVNP